MTRTVLVTGARGKTGRPVVDHLRRHPDVVVREGSSQPGAQTRFSWDDPATWSDAVADADAIYLMRPDVPDAPGLVAGLVDANPKAHVVLLSEQGAGGLPAEGWARRVEDAVVTRAESWTVLRPSWFHQVLTDPRFYRDDVRDRRVLSLPSGGGRIAWVDARDIAAVAVAALLAPADHRGQAYAVTGPAALTVADLAADLSTRLGHEVRPDDPAPETTVEGLDPFTTDILSPATAVVSAVRRSPPPPDPSSGRLHRPRSPASTTVFPHKLLSGNLGAAPGQYAHEPDVRHPLPAVQPRPSGGAVRRSFMLVAAAVLGAAASVVAAVPAQAAPIPVNFNNVTGTTHLAKPNVDVAVPTSVVQTQVDLDAKTLTGSAALAPLTAKLNLAHLIGVTSTVRVVPTGPLTGTIDLAASRLTTTTTFTLEVTNVHLDAAPAINLVPAGCRTSKPTTLTLQNTTPVDIFQPITTQGTYTIPSFTRCGVLTPLLSLLLSGRGNTMTLVLK